MHVMMPPVLGHMVVPKHGVAVMEDGRLQVVAGVDGSNRLELRSDGGFPAAAERRDTHFRNRHDGLWEPSQVRSGTCEDGSVKINNSNGMVRDRGVNESSYS